MVVQSLVTALYLLLTLFTATLLAVALVPLRKSVPPKQRYIAMLVGTVVTEFPWVFLGLKFVALFTFAGVGIFDRSVLAVNASEPLVVETIYDAEGNVFPQPPAETFDAPAPDQSLWSEWVYFVDIGVFLAYWALMLQMYFAKNVVDNATGFFRKASSTEAPTFFSAAFWFRIMNPLWRPRHLKVHKDICYATQEDLNQAGPAMETFLSLDLYHHPSYPQGRPVLIYIHAGSYQSGSKSFPFPPFLYYMTNHRWVVVCINTRLSPNVQYPTHLVDAKRALRWVRANIEKFGGDPNFIAVAGTASGAHIASMMALTQNDPFYQPGFEEVDTSVQACVVINGILDLTDSKRAFGKGFQGWFAKKIAGIDPESEHGREFLRLSSPVMLLKGLEQERRKSTASIAGERARAISQSSVKADERRPTGLTIGDQIPPFIIFHGAKDSLVPVRHVRDFVQTFKKVSKASMVYVEFPSANHMYNIIGCRSHYMAYGIERFLGDAHEKYTRI